MCSFDALNAFSASRLDHPGAASRPFDAGRDGLVPSGGAAAVILERHDLARHRGAAILGEVLGYGFSADGDHISVPSAEGPQRAMRKALANARLAPGDIDYVCAHATSTVAGDAAEAENLAAVFGDHREHGHGPPVSSLKALTGHELWMAGAAQVVYCVIMARQGFTCANFNFERPDDSSAKLNILTATRPAPPRRVLCNSLGFGGTNSCLVLDLAAGA